MACSLKVTCSVPACQRRCTSTPIAATATTTRQQQQQQQQRQRRHRSSAVPPIASSATMPSVVVGVGVADHSSPLCARGLASRGASSSTTTTTTSSCASNLPLRLRRRTIQPISASSSSPPSSSSTPSSSPGGGGGGGEPNKATVIPANWQVKYLYDGDCPMCRTLRNVLSRKDGDRGRVAFVNISDRGYDPAEHAGIEYEDAMETIHVIRRDDGGVVTGPDALTLLYDTVGMGWATRLSKLPVVSSIVDALYDLISKYRLGIGGVDAIIAMKRLSQVEQGEDQCDKGYDDDDDSGCEAPEW